MGFWGKLGSIGGMAGGAALLATGNPIGAGLMLGAGAGLAKHEFNDIPAAQAKMRLAAETARNRPWTGLTPETVDRPSAIGSSMQGGMTGLMLAQGLKGGAKPPVDGDMISSGSVGSTGPSLGVNTDLGYGNGIPAAPNSFAGFGNTGNYAGMMGSQSSWLDLMKRQQAMNSYTG